MKYVTKRALPAEFEAWKAGGTDDWQPTYANLQRPEKQVLHYALLAEQGWVCCYCGGAVTETDSHIEHFRPQRDFPALQLDYANLHASCMGTSRHVFPDDEGAATLNRAAKRPPTFCGDAKRNNFDEALHISPVDPNCESRFIYTSAGEILPADRGDESAKYMLKILALGLPHLSAAREEVLKVFDPTFLDTVTAEELVRLRDAYRTRNVDGKLQTFGHVAARYAEQCLGDFSDPVGTGPDPK
ncbi:retron system putative HNH endonuclease [Burkholderia gladioli]|uniref:retron system putative HNH endonuclease n=1 Tax=Burkholderia gladioli TaxID=28095 RepID=UPI003F7952CA